MYKVPHRINEPTLILFWPSTQFVPALGLMGCTILFGNFLLFFTMSVMWWIAYGYTSRRYAPGVMLHWLYWNGLTTGITKEVPTVPDALKREFFS
jgi:type IV conjugative transfer system protein TraL